MDPYPNAGEYFQPEVPAQTKYDNEEEKKQAAQALPFIDQVSAWFDDMIANTDSVTVVRQEAKRRDVPVEVAVEAYDIVREILQAKKGEFISLKMTFKK